MAELKDGRDKILEVYTGNKNFQTLAIFKYLCYNLDAKLNQFNIRNTDIVDDNCVVIYKGGYYEISQLV